MTITLNDPLRPLGRSMRPPGPEDVAVGDRGALPAFRDELRGSSVTRLPLTSPADEVRASVRARGSRGKTWFELASRKGLAAGG